MAWLQEGKGLTSQMLSVPSGRLLANRPCGKGRASWSLFVSSSSHLTPTQVSGPGSPLDRVLGEPLLPWRPRELAISISGAIFPKLLLGWNRAVECIPFSLSFLDYTLISLLLINVKHFYYPLIYPL